MSKVTKKVFGFHAIKPNTYNLLEETTIKLIHEGYKIVCVDDFLHAKFKDNDKIALYTFDDGYEYRDVRIAKFLEQMNISAISFVIIFGDNFGKTRVNWEFYRKYCNIFEVGSHTLSHGEVIVKKSDTVISNDNLLRYGDGLFTGQTDYALVSHELSAITDKIELQEEYMRRVTCELYLSKNIIERQLGVSCRFFAYPWGRYNEFVLQTVKRCGYEAAFGLEAHEPQLPKLPDTFEAIYRIPRVMLN